VRRRRVIPNDHCGSRRDPWGATYWRAQPSATGAVAELSMVVEEACTYKVSLWWPDVAGANPAVPVDIEVACLTSPCSGVSTQSVTVNQASERGPMERRDGGERDPDAGRGEGPLASQLHPERMDRCRRHAVPENRELPGGGPTGGEFTGVKRGYLEEGKIIA
jgi:hypothetical protein